MIINNNQDNNDNNDNQYNDHSGGKRREHVSSPSFQSLLRALGWNAERVDGRNNCSTENTVKLSFVFTIISCKWSIYLFIFAITVVTNQISVLYC